MLTTTEQQVAKTLGISAEAFAHNKGARSGRWRVALNTRETRGLIDSTYTRIAEMARSVGSQPAAFLSRVTDRALRELDETGGLDDSGASESKVNATPLLLNVTPEQIARVARHQQSDGGTFIPGANSGADEVSANDFIPVVTDIMADFSRWMRAADGGNPDIGELRSILEQNRNRIDDLLAKLADATAY